MNIEVVISSDLQRILDTSHKGHVEKTIRKACEELGQQVNAKIQEKGFAPRDTGKLAESHRVVSNDKEVVIVSGLMASNGVPLWNYIVNGHRTLTTDRSRRWWFWYLNNVLGGSYTPKTGGGGFVPPDRYHERAIQAINMNSVVSAITSKLVR